MFRSTLLSLGLVLVLGGCAVAEAMMEDLASAGPAGEPRATILSQSTTPGSGALKIEAVEPGAMNGLPEVVATAICGEDLACVDGWEIRILELAVSATHIPVRTEFPVRVRIQNRGTEASPLGEAHLCVGRYTSSSDCRAGTRTLLSIPSIESGGTVDLTPSVRAPDTEVSDHPVVLVPDPDRLWQGVRMEVARSQPISVEQPKLQFLELEADPVRHRSGRLTARGTIRNPSVATATPAVEMTVRPTCLSHRTPPPRITLPALEPRESFTFEIELNVGTGSHPNENCGVYGGTATLRFEVDPDGMVTWSRSHERQADTRYELTGR